jgi:hypothetical protein
MNENNPISMPFKEKLMIGLRIVFVVALAVMLVWEFIQPNENRFRSVVRILLWSVFLYTQSSYLLKKFRESGRVV